MNLFGILKVAIPCTMGATIVIVPSAIAIVENKQEPVPPQPTPDSLCFEKDGVDSDEDPTLQYQLFGTLNNLRLQYSYNDVDWLDWKDDGEIGDKLTIDDGQKLYVRNIVNNLSTSDDDYINFDMTGKIKCSGNINSLINYQEDTPDYCYYHLFDDCTSLTKAPDLPSINAGVGSYWGMFTNCGITQAPEIFAQTVQNYSCKYMFHWCTKLLDAPAIRATTVGEESFASMFSGCESLVNPPEILPANTIYYKTYASMFSDCYALTRAPVLPAKSLHVECYWRMFMNCNSLKILEDEGENIICDFSERTASFPRDATKDMFAGTGGSTTIVVQIGHFYCYE